jgi:hypothetical protein
MFMQSPFIVNLKSSYSNDKIGTRVIANFNYFGERLSGVTIGGTPNIYEQPRPSLRLSVQQRIFKRLRASVSASNLFNPEYQMVHEFKGQEYNFSNYRLGRTFSFGVTYSL